VKPTDIGLLLLMMMSRAQQLKNNIGYVNVIADVEPENLFVEIHYIQLLLVAVII